FKGYQALKIALATEIMTPIQQIHEEINENDDEITIANKIFKSNIRTLENTAQILEGSSFKKAVELILSANRVELSGIG
ncbi:RpiR family transcriptional regulator, partial [Pseudomonas sp. GP01-A3]